MAGITTHVLDTRLGQPAASVSVRLEVLREEAFVLLAAARTDRDGRASDLLREIPAPGTYRLTFDTGAYFTAQGVPAFYPSVAVVFSVVDPRAHHHVPLLLTPFGYTTYRGS